LVVQIDFSKTYPSLASQKLTEKSLRMAPSRSSFSLKQMPITAESFLARKLEGFSFFYSLELGV
jgi:hypothetical protein